jgi:hypothetical protein
MVIGIPVKALSTPMMERVQKRVLNQFSYKLTTPQAKKVEIKVHVKLTHREMLPSLRLSTVMRTSSPRKKLLLPALNSNVPWKSRAPNIYTSNTIFISKYN